MAYAVNTYVSIAKSKADIEEMIQKAGASQFVSGYKDNLAVIGFSLADRQIRFVLPLPDVNSLEFQLTITKRESCHWSQCADESAVIAYTLQNAKIVDIYKHMFVFAYVLWYTRFII